MLPFDSEITSNRKALLSPIEGPVLAKYASQVERGCIVEIGTFLGGTTAILATYSKVVVVTIDKYILGTNPLDVYSLLQDFSNVMIIVGDSPTIGNLWSTEISFLFIDGGHGYEDVKADFKSWSPHLTQDSVVAFHDARLPTGDKVSLYGYVFNGDPSVQQFITELVETGDWCVIEYVGSTAFIRRQ